MKADYVHKDTLTATDYVELNKNNELLISYNQALLKENQELKKQLEEKNKKYIPGEYATETFIKTIDENILLKNQQKNFIKYLEDEINKWNYNYDSYNYEYEIEEPTAEELANKILKKYTSTIGCDK